jgi:hypothetical protein
MTAEVILDEPEAIPIIVPRLAEVIAVTALDDDSDVHAGSAVVRDVQDLAVVPRPRPERHGVVAVPPRDPVPGKRRPRARKDEPDGDEDDEQAPADRECLLLNQRKGRSCGWRSRGRFPRRREPTGPGADLPSGSFLTRPCPSLTSDPSEPATLVPLRPRQRLTRELLEPAVGLEPTTCCLQDSCSAT